jgi:hypothetical protein
MMKHLEETTSRRALLAMALSGYGAMVFPIDINQDKASQSNHAESAKLFVGTWKGKSRPDMIADHVLVFKVEGERLNGTERQFLIRNEGDGRGPQLVRDEYVPLPDLSVEGKTLTWKRKWMQSDQESLTRVTLISDDEILVEAVGMQRSSDQPALIVPISYKLKREK